MHIRADAEFPLRQWKSATSTPHPHPVRARIAMHVCVNQEIPNVFVYPVFHSPLFIFIMLCVCVCLFLWVHIHFKRESVKEKKNRNPFDVIVSFSVGKLSHAVWVGVFATTHFYYFNGTTAATTTATNIFFPPLLAYRWKYRSASKIH